MKSKFTWRESPSKRSADFSNLEVGDYFLAAFGGTLCPCLVIKGKDDINTAVLLTDGSLFDPLPYTPVYQRDVILTLEP